jgi:hypothetical protein
MSGIITTTYVENLFFSLLNLDPDRPLYYLNVYRTGRNIFIHLGLKNDMKKLEILIKNEIEKPLKADFLSVIQAYYNQRFLFSKKAFCKIGDNIDPVRVTRYDLFRRLEKIKDFIMDRCSELAQHVRFRAVQQVQV